MKPTLSHDGLYRFNLTVRFRVGLYDLINAAALELFQTSSPDQTLDKITSTWTRTKCRQIWHKYAGRSDTLWAEAADTPVAYKMAATAQVEALFPDLVQTPSQG